MSIKCNILVKVLPILLVSLKSGSGSVYGFSSSSSWPTFIHRSFIICCERKRALRLVCHLPYPMKSALAGLGKTNLKIHNNLNTGHSLIPFPLTTYSHFFYLSHHFVSISSFPSTICPLQYNHPAQNTRKTSERKNPVVSIHKNVSFCILHFHHL